jgi:hypothetical protein
MSDGYLDVPPEAAGEPEDDAEPEPAPSSAPPALNGHRPVGVKVPALPPMPRS